MIDYLTNGIQEVMEIAVVNANFSRSDCPASLICFSQQGMEE